MRHGRSFPFQAHLGGRLPAQGVGSAFNVLRGSVIAGLDETGGEGQANGWNNKVRDGGVLQPKHVVRTSDEIVTITLPPIPLYDISSTETITGTAPNAALVTSGDDIVGSPTFDITAVAGGLSIPVAMHHYTKSIGAI